MVQGRNSFQMTDLPNYLHPLRVSDLPTRKGSKFLLEPDTDTRNEIARDLDIPKLRKIRFQGILSPIGKSGWRLEGSLGATVVQDCVVTLEPVSARLDLKVSRLYLADLEADTDTESEMPEDESVESLNDFIDVGLVMFEALALALPDYPRSTDATLKEQFFTEPDRQAMTDEDAKPFASLAALRDKLDKGD